MKYKLLFIPLFATLLLRCNSKENVINDDYCHYELTEPLFGIVDSFIQTTKDKDWRFYELYINRRTLDETIIILAATDESVIKDENTKSAIYTQVDGTQINIYSGTEQYLTSKQNPSFSALSSIAQKKRLSSKDRVYWVVISSTDSLKIISTDDTNIYPFHIVPMLFEKIIFKPPVFNHDKGEYE